MEEWFLKHQAWVDPSPGPRASETVLVLRPQLFLALGYFQLLVHAVVEAKEMKMGIKFDLKVLTASDWLLAG